MYKVDQVNKIVIILRKHNLRIFLITTCFSTTTKYAVRVNLRVSKSINIISISSVVYLFHNNITEL